MYSRTILHIPWKSIALLCDFPLLCSYLKGQACKWQCSDRSKWQQLCKLKPWDSFEPREAGQEPSMGKYGRDSSHWWLWKKTSQINCRKHKIQNNEHRFFFRVTPLPSSNLEVSKRTYRKNMGIPWAIYPTLQNRHLFGHNVILSGLYWPMAIYNIAINEC